MTNQDSTNAPQFSITRVFDAPRELVWRAWTDPTEFAAWLHPMGVETDGVSADVRVGGRYRYTMTNAETGQQFPTGGQYLEIDPMDRLVFTWGDPDADVESTPVLTLTFTPQADKTELVLHVLGYDGKPGDGFVYDGWDEALTNLEHHLIDDRG